MSDISYVSALKLRALDAEAERDYLRSLLDTFLTGNIPDNAGIEHLRMASWGRKRLEELNRQPVLLRSE